jgi:hypothetical protein
MTDPLLTEVVDGVTFHVGQIESSICEKFWVCPVEIEFDGRNVSYVMDAVYLDFVDARRHHFKRMVELLRDYQEKNA